MAMKVSEVREWLEGLPKNAEVGVDDGGLCLRVAGDEKNYCEVGGLPETVACSVCGNKTPADTAHLHQEKWIGECCWDERLKASE